MSFFDTGYFKGNASRSSLASKRNINNKIIAWGLDEKYYDGKRINGYGGFKYDGRWKKFLPKIIKKYRLSPKSKVLDLGCKKGFFLKDLRDFIPGIKIYGIENHSYPITSISTSPDHPVKEGGLTKYTGDILYHENISPITRRLDQKENFKFVFEF